MMKSKKVLREILADGGAVVLPTETVYGLFAKAMDESAVNHVYAVSYTHLTLPTKLEV